MSADSFKVAVTKFIAGGKEAVAEMAKYGSQGVGNVSYLQGIVDKLEKDTPAMIESAKCWDGTATPPPATKPPGLYYLGQAGLDRTVQLVFPVPAGAEGDRHHSSEFGGLLKKEETLSIVTAAPDKECDFTLSFQHSGGATGPSAQRTFSFFVNNTQVASFDGSDGGTAKFHVGATEKAGYVNCKPKDTVKYKMVTKPGLTTTYADVNITIGNPSP